MVKMLLNFIQLYFPEYVYAINQEQIQNTYK